MMLLDVLRGWNSGELFTVGRVVDVVRAYKKKAALQGQPFSSLISIIASV
ncbi:hypothetical protein [Prosthecochloris sp. HL-130-GSB]|nr:hypothetical protein [Prosthecochloris sp. HL-130-GSB]